MAPSTAIVAVLAGGRGERLGGAKPSATLGGRALIEYPLRVAAAAGLEALVVAKSDSPLPPLQVPLLLEPELPRHPLQGLVSALEHARAQRVGAVLGVACDMPFLEPGLLDWLARIDGAAIAWNAHGPQPALCRCEIAHLPALRGSLAREQALTSALLGLRPRIVGVQELARFGDPERLCFNVNSPEELALAQRWLAQSPPASRAAASRS